jgi:hypothetical protein
MARSNDGEVATIEGCDLCKAEPFGDCHDGRVDAPKRKFLVLRDQSAHQPVVPARRLDHRQHAHRERMQKLASTLLPASRSKRR